MLWQMVTAAHIGGYDFGKSDDGWPLSATGVLGMGLPSFVIQRDQSAVFLHSLTSR